MANNKNQHYVPRVHLRPFTLDGGGVAINLLNVDRMRPVRNAPVKNQCSGDYFYGRDDRLERAIGMVEGAYGEVVRSLVRAGAVIDAKARTVILRFAYLQHLRTEAASRKLAEMTALMGEVPGSDLPAVDAREATRAAVQVAMLQFAQSMSIVDDLKVCIARNRTGQPFITSDDPAVLTNRLFIQRRHGLGRGFGVGSAGAILLLPLSPELCVVAYDAGVYAASQQVGWVDVTREVDVHALNEHQILNCVSNVYFRDWNRRDDLARTIAERLHLRPTRRHVIVHAVLDRETEWGRTYAVREVVDPRKEAEVLVHVRANHPRPSAWPSFLRFRPDARAFTDGRGAGLTRKGCLDRAPAFGRGYRSVRV